MKKYIFKRSLQPSEPPPPGGARKGTFQIFLIKTVLTILLALFAGWLIKTVYFPEAEAHRNEGMIAQKTDTGVFHEILSDEKPIPREHFHIVDELLTQPEPFHPLCLNCHGTYPHSKEKKVRSILNFHNGFIACTVCHVRKSPEDTSHLLVWVDRQTGATSMSVEGGFGRYPAKIYSARKPRGGHLSLIQPVDEKSAREFTRLKEKFTPDQMAKAKIRLHEGISKKPVFCNECHKKNGYLDFAKLGFPDHRVDHLTSTEITGMIEKYETFYLPESIDFGKDKG